MRLFDTHCHFEDLGTIGEIVSRAREAGVERILAVGGSANLNATALAAMRGHGCLAALGYDRDQVDAERPPIDAEGLSAWGEIGLDYHYSPETRERQCSLFSEELEKARKLDLPVVIHTREADDDTLSILRSIPSRGIIHSYTGTQRFARELLDLGFYVSFSGIVTFKAADNVRESAAYVPLDRMLIETDSPFLAPVPMRGRRNEPAFIRHTCSFLAELRGIGADAFAELAFANAEAALGIAQP